MMTVSAKRFWIFMVKTSIIAVLWMLMTACFTDSPACGDKAPVVTRGTLGQTSETDPVILARHLIARSADEPSLEIPDFSGHDLTDEIARVLRMIRSTWPEMAEINARPLWEPGTLILHLEPFLFEAVSLGLPEEEGVSAPFCTGHPGFDALNAAVGLRGVEILSFGVRIIVIKFDPDENVHSASVSYEDVEGVIFAEPDIVLGDGSNIEMLWSDGKWYVVFRKAWGDCPSGCIFSELYFFVEHEGDVKRIDLERAAEIEEFAKILAVHGWMQRPEKQ